MPAILAFTERLMGVFSENALCVYILVINYLHVWMDDEEHKNDYITADYELCIHTYRQTVHEYYSCKSESGRTYT
jgi:hypothetical protein